MAKEVVINRKRPMSKDEIAVNVVGVVLIGLFALICVVPFYLIIIASFTSESSLSVKRSVLLSIFDYKL